MKKFIVGLMMLSMMALLVACGGNDKEQETEAPKDEAEEKETITVSHKYGDPEVQKNPETIVVFDFGILDTLDELGIEVTGVPKATIPSYLSQYAEDKYTDVGSLKEPDFEKIHAMNPDVIFISDRQADMYDELSNIAPTVYVGIDHTNYMESFKNNMALVAELFDKETEVNEELDEIDGMIDSIQEKAEASDEKALIVLGTEGKVSAFGPNSRFGLIHDVFGFKPADEKIEISRHGQGISFEYILETNPDILFVVDRDAAIGGDASVKDTIENDIVRKTTAYENDNIVYLNPDSWYLSGGGLQSVKEMVQEVESVLD